jgi:hypothetical protein
LTALGSLAFPAAAGAATSLDALHVSPATSLQLDVAGAQVTVQDRHVVSYTAAGSALADLGPLAPGVGIESFHVDASGARYFSIDVNATLGGVFVEPRDVVRWNGTSYTKYLSGSATGIPPGIAIDAFAIDASGANLLSFDLPVSAGGVLVEPGDLVVWGSPPVLRFDASAAGIPANLDLDAAAALSNGHLLLSFDGRGSLAGVPAFEASDVLEFDPETATWQLSVISEDFDPGWSGVNLDALHAVVGVAHVGVPAPAVVKMVPIDPSAPPRSYQLRLECGPRRIARIAAGIILAPNVPAANLTFVSFGPSVDPGAAVVDYPPGSGTQRADTIYVELPGAAPSGFVCMPGQEVVLAGIEIRGGSGPLPAPLLTGEGAGFTLRESGVVLDPLLLAHESGVGSDNASYELLVRPELGDTSGLRFELLIRGSVRLNQLGVALLPPDGVGTALSFGGCTIPAGPNNARSCEGATLLGPHVDARLSSTLGPSPGIGALGGHPAAIYLKLVGATRVFGTLPALDLPGSAARWTLLGILVYGPGVPSADRKPPSIACAGLGPGDGVLPPTLDEFGAPMEPISDGSGPSRGAEGTNTDNDGYPDDGTDVCIGSPSNADSGSFGLISPQDGIGNDCQCGDVANPSTANPDGLIEAGGDVARIRGALAGAAALAPSNALKCNVRGPIDATPSSLGLRQDCSIADVVVLRRLLSNAEVDGQTIPLFDPLALQNCDAP